MVNVLSYFLALTYQSMDLLYVYEASLVRRKMLEWCEHNPTACV